MRELKKSPRQQLEKFSTIFMQLGLVLVMFVVFISLEHETEQTAVVIEPMGKTIPDVFSFETVPIFEKEVIKEVKPKVERQATVIIKPEVVPDTDVVDKVVAKPTDYVPTVDIENTVVKKEEDIDDGDDPTPVAINYVSKIPVFAGCENLSEEEGRKCFDKKINKLINRHFNTDLGNELGLKSGKNKILTQFVIDKTGNIVDIKIRAPHDRLKKETQRIINKIPVFTPGENNGKAVNVRYTLPINFQVE